MRIRDIMTKNPLTVDSETPIFEAKSIMKENSIRRLPVMDKGKLVGIITERMILETSPSPATSLSIHEVHYLISKMKVKDIMVKNPITVSPDTTFEEALLLGQEKRIGASPWWTRESCWGLPRNPTWSDLSPAYGGRGRRLPLL